MGNAEILARIDAAIAAMNAADRLDERDMATLRDLLDALGDDGAGIVKAILRRERQTMAVRLYFENHRQRVARIGGWIVAGLTGLWAVRDYIADIISALRG